MSLALSAAGPAGTSASEPDSSIQPVATGAASAPVGSGNAPQRHHILAVCWSEEDAASVRAVAEELAADPGSTLALHLRPASLPPGAAPSLDAAAVSARLRAHNPRETRLHPPDRSRNGNGNASSHNETNLDDRSDDDGGGGSSSRAPGPPRARLGRVLLSAALLGSTQDVLRTHGSALGDGAVVVADRQTGGRGRGGNVWTSPPGCLMFSALRRLRVASPAQAPFINYLVCLAVTRGVTRALLACGLPPVALRIKWPNDIYADGVKIGGALINTTWQGSSFNVITGIGLNVNNRTPTTCLDELVERAAAAAATAAPAAPTAPAAAGAAGPSGPVCVPREAVLAGILSSLEEVFDTFEVAGFGPLESEYLASWLHSGQELDFDDSDPATATAAASTPTGPDGPDGPTGQSPRRVRLTIRGLSPSGFLLATDGSGGRYELTPDGNSLDMMAGLIRRKIL